MTDKQATLRAFTPRQLRVVAILASITIAGCGDIVNRDKEWRCFSKAHNAPVTFIQRNDPDSFGGVSTDGWEWDSLDIRECQSRDMDGNPQGENAQQVSGDSLTARPEGDRP